MRQLNEFKRKLIPYFLDLCKRFIKAKKNVDNAFNYFVIAR